MGNDYHSNRSGKRSYGRGGDRGQGKTMHQAVCDKCGDSCQVPFKPSGNKPVFCSKCFDQHGDRDNKRGYKNSRGRNSGGRRDYDRPQMHSATCDNCGIDCQVPFKPSTDKPIYCDSCFGAKRDSRDGGRGSSRDESKQIRSLTQKINNLDAKLDQVLILLTLKNNSTQEPTTSAEAETEAEEKPVKKKKAKATKKTTATKKPKKVEAKEDDKPKKPIKKKTIKKKAKTSKSKEE